jgi:hypothetical protein
MQKVALAFLPLITVAACSGDGGGSVPIGDLGSRVLDVLCARAARCGEYPDKATCVANNGKMSDMGQVESDVASGKVKYNGSQVATCLSVYDTIGCTVMETQNLHMPQSCQTVFQGTVATGGACYNDEECVSLNCNRGGCGGVTGCCAGTCDPVTVTVASGGDCVAAGTTCADGTYCKLDSTSTGATCTPRIAAGQSCTSLFGQCVAGKACTSDTMGGTRTCGNLPAEGQACPDNICDANADACDRTTNTCTRKIAIGGACPSGAGCVDYATCDATTKVCVAQKAAGGTCSTATDCLGSLVCTTGTCVSAPALPVCP